jgi:hypothetical protein
MVFYSRTIEEHIFQGGLIEQIKTYGYSNVKERPLSGKGFVGLINKLEIENLYGQYFKILSIDKLQYTINNGSQTISNSIIICRNE